MNHVEELTEVERIRNTPPEERTRSEDGFNLGTPPSSAQLDL